VQASGDDSAARIEASLYSLLPSTSIGARARL
jgi:hypothetical protein